MRRTAALLSTLILGLFGAAIASAQSTGGSAGLPVSGISFRDWLFLAFASAFLTAGITIFAFYPFPKRPQT
jgi:hypothetical protein